MDDFEKVLLRLKERLGVSSDKAVAELLGMGDKALNARKRRGAFPVEKLKALAADRPELGLDVRYVLTGYSEALESRLDALKAATSKAVALGLPEREGEFVRDVIYGADMKSSALVRESIETYVAERISRSGVTPTSGTNQNFHAAVEQVAGRDIVNKRGGKKKR